MHIKELRAQVRMRSLEASVCCERQEWLEHLIRIDGNRLVSRVWGGIVMENWQDEGVGGCIQNKRLQIWPEVACIGGALWIENSGGERKTDQ